MHQPLWRGVPYLKNQKVIAIYGCFWVAFARARSVCSTQQYIVWGGEETQRTDSTAGRTRKVSGRKFLRAGSLLGCCSFREQNHSCLSTLYLARFELCLDRSKFLAEIGNSEYVCSPGTTFRLLPEQAHGIF